MANVIPFKGILYDPSKIYNLADVTTPPFDVISEQERDMFYECHPQNIIRLILNKSSENDTSGNNTHTRAAVCFNSWLSEGILRRDNAPAFYLTSVDFPSENKMLTRFGLITRVGLEPFEKGVVLPHERTFSNVKSERLGLMKSCHANFSPIFSLYSDQRGILDTLKEAALNTPPDMDFTDKKGHRHKLWRITDPAVHAYVTVAMKGKSIFIADGHHRYETALNYRAWAADNVPGFSEEHPANYVMMYLSSMEDPGVVILPAHRMLKGIQEDLIEKFIHLAENYFDIVVIPFGGNGDGSARSEFISRLKSDTSKHVIGVSMKNTRHLYLLTLKPGVMKRMFSDELPDSLRDIDVTVLTRLILMEILGFDQARLDNEKLIGYSSIADEAIDAAISGNYDMTFILNPTRIDQVRNIAQAKLLMPRKATYFYPKVIVGQVINELRIAN